MICQITTGELGYDRLNGTRKICPSYAKSVKNIRHILDMHGTGTKHIVRHRQKSIVQSGPSYPSSPVFALSYSVCTSYFSQQIDGEAFLLLNQSDIVKIMNIKLGPALKIYNSILMLRNSMGTES